MTGLLVGLSCGALIGWAARVTREKARFRRIRDAVMDELARQEAEHQQMNRSRMAGLARWRADRDARLIEEAIEESAELAEKRRETHGE